MQGGIQANPAAGVAVRDTGGRTLLGGEGAVAQATRGIMGTWVSVGTLTRALMKALPAAAFMSARHSLSISSTRRHRRRRQRLRRDAR